jgi:hypothetical protein
MPFARVSHFATSASEDRGLNDLPGRHARHRAGEHRPHAKVAAERVELEVALVPALVRER